MQSPGVRAGRSELLKDMLEAGRTDSDSAGLYTKIRSMVTEVTEISPLRLANMLSSLAQECAKDLCYRSAEYVLDKIEKQSELRRDEIERATLETTDLFGEFLSSLRTAIMQEFVGVENYIFDHTYIVNPELFEGGFIRFRHQEGIDYTDPDGAHELAQRVAAAETDLESKLRSVQSLRRDVMDIDELMLRLDELQTWLDEALQSDPQSQGRRIRALADEIEQTLNLLRDRHPF